MNRSVCSVMVMNQDLQGLNLVYNGWLPWLPREGFDYFCLFILGVCSNIYREIFLVLTNVFLPNPSQCNIWN